MRRHLAILPIAAWSCTFGIITAEAHAQLPEVSTLQEGCVYLEPVFLKVSFQSEDPQGDPPRFHFLVNEKPLLVLAHGPTPYVVSETDNGHRTFELLVNIGAFPEPENYKEVQELALQVKEVKSASLSKKLRLALREPSEADRIVATVLKRFSEYVTAGTPEERLKVRQEREDALRSAIASYPLSRMTKYARVALLNRDFEPGRRPTKDDHNSRLTPREYHADLLARYGNLYTELPVPSVMHCEASLKLSSCLEWVGDGVKAKAILGQLRESYGKHCQYGKEIQLRIEDIERRLK